MEHRRLITFMQQFMIISKKLLYLPMSNTIGSELTQHAKYIIQYMCSNQYNKLQDDPVLRVKYMFIIWKKNETIR